MTRLLTLALLAVAASATITAQTPVFEVRDAAGATLLFAINDDGTATCTNCVVTDALADGAVTPEKVAGGLFNSLTRSSIYMRSNSASASGEGASVAAAVVCDEPEDIPATGECYAAAQHNVILRNLGPLDWDDPSQAAGYSCIYRNNSENIVTIQARIWCLDVTPDTPTLAPDLAPSPEQ